MVGREGMVLVALLRRYFGIRATLEKVKRKRNNLENYLLGLWVAACYRKSRFKKPRPC